jgi:hypothetical protein
MGEHKKRTTPIGAADRYAEAEERRQREAFRQLPAWHRARVHLRTGAVIGLLGAILIWLVMAGFVSS